VLDPVAVSAKHIALSDFGQDTFLAPALLRNVGEHCFLRLVLTVVEVQRGWVVESAAFALALALEVTDEFPDALSLPPVPIKVRLLIPAVVIANRRP
jgi:hypothetical protein